MHNLNKLFTILFLVVSLMTRAGEITTTSEAQKENKKYHFSQNDLKLTFGGRIQMDGALYQGTDYQPMGNGVAFRRIRFSATASFGKYLSARIEPEYTGGAFILRDCFVKYDMLNGFNFRLGNFQEGFSMQTMTSSADFTFIESPNVVTAFSPEHHIGMQASYAGKYFVGMAGIHFQQVISSTEKTNVEQNIMKGRNEGISYTARTVWMPRSADNTLGLHFALAASYRTPKNDVDIKSVNSVRYSSTSLTGIDKTKFTDTGVITNVNHDWLMGAELAGYYKNMSFQGEYIVNNTYRTENLATEHLHGFYGQATCLLFGGHPRYVSSRGAFTQPSLGKEWGDVELSARYEQLDLNGVNVKGGRSTGCTFGINYYANKNLRMGLNYSYVTHDEYASGVGTCFVGNDVNGTPTAKYNLVDPKMGKPGNDYGIISARVQLDF